MVEGICMSKSREESSCSVIHSNLKEEIVICADFILVKDVKAFLKDSKVEATPEEKSTPSYDPKIYKTFFPMPMQSNYIVETFPIPHFTHEDTPKLHVLCKKQENYFEYSYIPIAEILSTDFFQEEIKEKGGAYGAGTHISQNGSLNCYSYRDPHLLQTYQSFEKGIQGAANGSFRLVTFV